MVLAAQEVCPLQNDPECWAGLQDLPRESKPQNQRKVNHPATCTSFSNVSKDYCTALRGSRFSSAGRMVRGRDEGMTKLKFQLCL